MTNDLEPGRMVEYLGDLYMIEEVTVRVMAQRIESMLPAYDRFIETGEGQTHSPSFLRLEGTPGCGPLAPDKFKLLYKAEEL